IESRNEEQSALLDDSSTGQARHNFWVLRRSDGGAPMQPDETLRTAGVVEGDLLGLTTQRALTPPALSDDVVDAAARLNKAGYAGWDATAARWMAFAGLYLAAAVWVYLVVDRAFSAHRGAFAGLSTVIAAVMVGVGALARRSYGDRGIGAALGW